MEDPRQTALEAMKKAVADSNPETAHTTADQILCELLVSLGYAEIVEEFAKVHKWYS